MAALSLATGVGSLPAIAEAREICTIIADAADGRVLVEDGDCAMRATPASTFKIPLAAIGFDVGLLQSAEEPSWQIREGEPDWGGEAWRQPTGPAHWMRHSVVWYSQRMAAALGASTLTGYATDFGYGNADFAGDPGQDNGLERAWISSSLQISPAEQIVFLRRLVSHDLPISENATAQTMAIVEGRDMDAGWRISGKTGGAYPRNADRSFDYARGFGWFVGWAERDGRQVVFARLDQDETRHDTSPGLRARDAFLAAWPALQERVGR